MLVVRDVRACPPQLKGAVVALGNFDGVHVGHRQILRECAAIAKASGKPAAVMTFWPHPREFFNPSAPRLRLSSLKRKLALMRAAGMDGVFMVRFNARFAGLTAERFVQEVLAGALGASHVVTGYNFAFGKGRGGDTQFLSEQAARLRMGFTACPPVEVGQGVVSSSAVRGLLAQGEVKQAAALLGAPYTLDGYVRHGDARGKQLGYATANLSMDGLFVPRMGVYACWLLAQGKRVPAVANLGVRPTFGASAPVLEVHALEGAPQLYGQYVQVEMVDFVREEQLFAGAEALKAQIARDVVAARALLAEAA